jgi:hypothetical protein
VKEEITERERKEKQRVKEEITERDRKEENRE